MIKLLLDANQSPETGKYLSKRFGVVTFDLDFGEIYYFKEKGRLGVIILRLEDQTVESVIRRLERFFEKEAANLSLNKKLVVLTEDKVRMV